VDHVQVHDDDIDILVRVVLVTGSEELDHAVAVGFLEELERGFG
jgi:hypothetical protein